MPHYGWANGDSVDGFFLHRLVLVQWEVDAILGKGYGNQGQNFVALLQGSEMPAGFHHRNSVLGLLCFRLFASNVYQWSNG